VFQILFFLFVFFVPFVVRILRGARFLKKEPWLTPGRSPELSDAGWEPTFVGVRE